MTTDVVDINTGEIQATPLGVCPVCKQTAFTDLVLALGKLREPDKSGKAQMGNRGTYTYLTLSALLQAVRQPLAEHHLAVMQEVTTGDRTVTVVTVLLHASGYAFRSPAYTLAAVGNGSPQDMGSVGTYAKRQSLAAMVGLAGAEDDDDAAQASRRATPQTVPPAPPELPPRQAGGTPTPNKPASEGSRKWMMTLFTRAGMTRDQRRAYTANHLHLPADYITNELTQVQVSAIIDALQAQGSDTTI